MPRIRNSKNDPLDFCKKCFPKSEETARQRFGGRETGPDGRGDCFCYDDEHPDYEDDGYVCDKCGKTLTANDNYLGGV